VEKEGSFEGPVVGKLVASVSAKVLSSCDALAGTKPNGAPAVGLLVGDTLDRIRGVVVG
jgi:hypothetical protein